MVKEDKSLVWVREAMPQGVRKYVGIRGKEVCGD